MDESGFAVGAIIVSYNTCALLDSCLTSLAAELDRSCIEATCWVVDNASSDGSAEMVTRRHPWARAYASSDNLGFAAGNNVVLRRWADRPGRAPAMTLLLNPDTELQPGALDNMVAGLDAASDIGVVGPALQYPDGSFQHAAFRFPGLTQTALDLFPVDRLMDSRVNGRYPRSAYRSGKPFDVDMTLGACMLARTSAIAVVGPLDDGYFMYAEEVDWCKRFRQSGYRVRCVPSATVIHHAGASTRGVRPQMFVTLWRSRLRYFRKHEPALRRMVLEWLIKIGLNARSRRDVMLVRRGEIDEHERLARAQAYAAVFDGDTS